MNAPRFAWILALSLLTFAGCGGDDEAGEGEIAITVYGESFIEDGIPADEVDDGWSVTFERFMVTVEGVTVGGQAAPGPWQIDLTASSSGAGHPVDRVTVAEGGHNHASFTLSRVEIRGEASKDGARKTFDWTIEAGTHYSHCETTTQVPDGGEGTFQITVHADHLLYDSLASEEPGLRFDALAAADADGDGEITRAELEATDIGAYDPGSAGGVEDLWAWLVAQSRTLGHVDGEGHCEWEAR